VRPAAEARGIAVQPVLDPAAGPVSGDADRLQQVVWNLLSNAIKFTPRGGRVQVRLTRADSHVEVAVADTGAGIEPEFLPHVFERFRQADASSTRRHGGLGLGLAIVRHLAELHGGTVGAQSAGAGQGSVFTVRLPLMALRPAAGTAPVASEGAPAAAGEGTADLTGTHVLLVDDDEDGRELVATILSARGALVRTAASAAAALQALGEQRPDVLLSDIEMPGQDGYALVREVRRRESEGEGSRLPAIAFTAYARAEDRQRALAAGFDAHVAKPISPGELLGAVARAVGREAAAT
jgi:CheY-like chemotaxis protein